MTNHEAICIKFFPDKSQIIYLKIRQSIIQQEHRKTSSTSDKTQMPIQNKGGKFQCRRTHHFSALLTPSNSSHETKISLII